MASSEAGALPMQGEAIVLTVAYGGCRWVALPANLPDGHAHYAAVELALTLASMAATVAEVWLGPRERAVAAGTAKDAMRKPA